MSTFTLKGDGHDSREKFEDFLRELISDNNVAEFMNDDIDAEEPYSEDNAAVKHKQQSSVGKMVTALIKIAEQDSTLRSLVRNVETSAAYATPVKKMRKLIDLYRQQVKPNPAKNSALTEQRTKIFLKLTSEVQLKQDVWRLLNEIVTVENEMEEHTKWSEVTKMEKIISLLHSVEDLNPFFHSQDIYNSVTTYDLFRQRLLEACTGIANRKRNQLDRNSTSIMSTNSTAISDSETPIVNSTMTVDSSEYREFQDFKRQKQSRGRSNSNDRSSRSDSRDRRTQSPSSAQRRARFSNRSRSRSNERRDRRKSSSPANRSAMRRESQFGSPYQAPHGQQDWTTTARLESI